VILGQRGGGSRTAKRVAARDGAGDEQGRDSGVTQPGQRW
jgi:hypothetical protein